MAVTDTQLATLRAQLAGNVDEHKRLLEVLDLDGADRIGYATLLGAGFFEAVNRRFYEAGTISDVVAFVSDLRAYSDDMADSLDPRVAERMIRHSLGDSSDPAFDSIADIDDDTVQRAQILLLAALIGDEQLDEPGLDGFMAKARETADHWMALDDQTGGNGRDDA